MHNSIVKYKSLFFFIEKLYSHPSHFVLLKNGKNNAQQNVIAALPQETEKSWTLFYNRLFYNAL